ncbi:MULTISPECIES: metal ABC transporter ATP-binding protein [Kocuria]|uniref:Zinc ABC transporter, ATP-binding protein ZnuC n=1 Tax=Kocuria palustris PEL TaxID=1236550 RepID=M2XT97_9MICC|nr:MULTISPECIES: metal ABC transporter ATP-binding protein [Kocuria]EME36043.1 Zinc ABC transporter, ATP-binding protein ZnuC [Kocuria palustris PEL]MBM7823887.1 zinc/manganese transport system ATP-binding protein [Kocuria palustris]MCM3331722.1 metal ABC transporter ATP-binding protein [Kocuria palustris]MCT1835089.1 metal ABC transporter ATP-binding protein [Kocuria palustris]GLU86353.1 ABC transporter ATP-binding protein [Kocuria sp. NBRC 114282]
MSAGSTEAAPVVEFRRASLSMGRRTLWSGLDLQISPGEYIAVLGGNGTGKTSLLRVLLGLQPLSGGEVRVQGQAPRRGSTGIGYVPQQRAFAREVPMRGRDLVGMGLDGHRWGPRLRGRASARRRIDEALQRVGALDFADAPVGLLSGGEQQRLRIAQAMITDPDLLLFDEALLSLDLSRQRDVAGLVAQQSRRTGAAVVFVTHDVNPIIDDVDRVLYLANGSFRIGTPDEVLRTDVLSELYGTPIEVVRAGGRIIVVGAEREHAHHLDSDPSAHEGAAVRPPHDEGSRPWTTPSR